MPGESDTEELTEKATFKPGLKKGQRMGVRLVDPPGGSSTLGKTQLAPAPCPPSTQKTSILESSSRPQGQADPTDCSEVEG